MWAAKSFAQFGNIEYRGDLKVSRIGKNPIQIPDKVQINIDNGIINVKGPLGELYHTKPNEIDFVIENSELRFTRQNEMKKVKSLHGLTRALTANMVQGVSNGFEKVLLVEGVGYKAELKGEKLLLSLGFSHPILFIPPVGISFELTNANTIKIKGIDKQLVGQVAAKIRKLRKPEPYKGKGVKYQGEYIRRKAGKTAAK